MGSDVLKLPAQEFARLARTLSARRSANPLRIGLVRDAETRNAMGSVPRFPGLDVVTFELETDGAFADFDVSARSRELAAQMEAAIREFIAKGRLDLVIEATGRTLTGAMVCQAAIDHGHTIVSLNPRTDLALGRYLRHQAHSRGLRYVFWQPETVRSALELRHALELAGLRIVSLGAAVPAGEGDDALSPSDASSVMIEMACLANATGISLERPGMNGLRCSLDELARHYRPMEAGGILAVDNCIDYVVLDDGKHGVYAVVEEPADGTADAEPTFRTVYSPVVHFEHGWLAGIAEALDEDRELPEVTYRPVADVCAIAVRDVKPGERLAGTGDADYRNVAMRIDEVRWRESIPIGLLEGAMAKQVIEPDEPIVLENCAIDHTSRLFMLRGVQEALRPSS